MPDADPAGGVWTDLIRIYRHMSHDRRRQFYALIALMALGAAAELATIGSILPFLSLLADPLASAPSRWLPFAQPLGIAPVAAGATLFSVLVLIAGAIRLKLVRAVQDFSYRLGHEIMVDIQRRVLLQPYSFHLERNSSTLLAAIEQVEVLVFDLILPSMQALVAGFLALFITAALISIDPLAALVAAVASSAVYIAVSAIARKRLKENSDVVAHAFNRRMKVAQESLGSIRDIIIDGSQELHVKEFQRVDFDLSIARSNTGFIAAAPRYVIETVGIVLIALIALWLAQGPAGMTAALPALGAIAFGAQRLLPLLQQVYHGWSTASGYLSVLRQVSDLLELPADPPAAASTNLLPLREKITIEGVSFTYAGRKRPALDAVSFDIPAGKMVALVGETGSGKSTLADLLMGLLNPQSGRITIDGMPLSKGNLRQWQGSLAHVPQSIFLADTSIARNIALSVGDNDIDMSRVRQAAEIAQLDAFVDTLPDAYLTVVGERGVRLSGGQRQRLGLARAIFKQGPMMILDEPTSALDEETEAAVLDALDELRSQGRTMLVIAHRRSTIARADLIVTLSKGRVAKVEHRTGAQA